MVQFMPAGATGDIKRAYDDQNLLKAYCTLVHMYEEQHWEGCQQKEPLDLLMEELQAMNDLVYADHAAFAQCWLAWAEKIKIEYQNIQKIHCSC